MDARWAWIANIKKGDILVEGGTPRIVRYVHHYKIPPGKGTRDGSIRTYVAFTIRRCSWTTRCYTLLTTHDLKQRKFRPTGKRKILRSRMDREIELEIINGLPLEQVKLHCCDVEGIG